MSEPDDYAERVAQARPRILSKLRAKYFAWFAFTALLVAAVLVIAWARDTGVSTTIAAAAGFVVAAAINFWLQLRAMKNPREFAEPTPAPAAKSPFRRTLEIAAIMLVLFALAFAIYPPLAGFISGFALGIVVVTCLVVTGFQSWYGDKGTDTVVASYLQSHPEILGLSAT